MVLVHLVHAGTRVHKGDVLAEFDQQDQLKQFRDSQADYLGFLDKIKKQQADNATDLAKDQTALQAADDAYQKDKLEMAKNEVVSRIDADRNRLMLEQDEATLKQLRETFDLKERARQTQLKDLEIQRDKARGQMLYAQINAQRMVIHSPLEGLVVLNPVWKGSSMGDPQEGDEIWPGLVLHAGGGSLGHASDGARQPGGLPLPPPRPDSGGAPGRLPRPCPARVD